MAKIVWLASYPKSGNTWMRIFLNNYVRDTSEPADINKLEGGPIANGRLWFDEWVGVEASSLDDKTIESLRPDVYRCLARAENQTLYMKVHDSWRQTARGEGLFPADCTAGVVYILRNPLDMVASTANHWDVSLEKAVDGLCLKDLTLARSIDGLCDQLEYKLGSWSDHVVSWLDNSGLPVHLVRYEDLKRNPVQYFGEVVKFCGLPYDVERVRRSVAFSDFSELQRQERENDFCERPKQTQAGFFRKGQTGGWREELPTHLVKRLIDMHCETMRRFGYLDENNQPV